MDFNWLSIQRPKPPLWLCFFSIFLSVFSNTSGRLWVLSSWPASQGLTETSSICQSHNPLSSIRSLSLSLSLLASQQWQRAQSCNALRWVVPRPAPLAAKALVAGCVMGKSVCLRVCELVPGVSRVHCWESRRRRAVRAVGPQLTMCGTPQ